MSGGKERVFVFGASGHAKVVIDVIEKHGCFEIYCIVDDDKYLKGNMFCNYPVIGGREELLQEKHAPDKGIVAIGNNKIRCAISQWLERQKYGLISAVHPSSQIGRDVDVGPGSVIMANTVVNPYTIIGRDVIVNTGATVDHDCKVGNGVHIAPGTTVCGSVQIGDLSFIGAGSTVVHNMVIGSDVLVGAGTTVYENISDRSKVVGAR